MNRAYTTAVKTTGGLYKILGNIDLNKRGNVSVFLPRGFVEFLSDKIKRHYCKSFSVKSQKGKIYQQN